MSEDDKSHTTVLLPGARVMLFTRDEETKAAFLALSSDWRFARVVLQAEEGGVDEAVARFGQEASPALVIIQTETTDAGFSLKLESLGGVCAEGTGAIIIGPVNDVNLYRKLVSMGVSDYLVKPVKTEMLGNEIASTLINQMGATGSRLVALMGTKGGVGTTVLAESLAWGISEKFSQKTFLLDAAGGWSSLSVGMDFEPTTTLTEAVRAAVEGNADSLTRMVHESSEKLFVLSSGGDVMLDDSVDAGMYETLLTHLMVTYPMVIVDLSGASPALKRTVLTRAHQVLMITVPTLPAVRAARTLLQEIKDLRGGGGTDVVEIILNMQGLSAKNEVSRTQIEEGLERKVAAVLPFDPGLFLVTESEAKKLHQVKEGEALVDRLLAVVRKVLAGTGSDTAIPANDEPKKAGISGMLQKLKNKS